LPLNEGFVSDALVPFSYHKHRFQPRSGDAEAV
jgi:hypothetical protein